jgi:hypothetical protein
LTEEKYWSNKIQNITQWIAMQPLTKRDSSELGVMVHVCNPSTQEAEAGGSRVRPVSKKKERKKEQEKKRRKEGGREGRASCGGWAVDT